MHSLMQLKKEILKFVKLLINNPKIDINQKLIHFYNLKFILMK